MRKILIVISLMMFCIVFSAPVFAATISSQTSISGSAFTPSSGVRLSVSSDANSYCATSKHYAKGTREYGTCGGTMTNTTDVTKIYQQAVSPSANVDPTSVTANDGSAPNMTAGSWAAL